MTPERIAKLERAVKAGMALRKVMEDIAPASRMLSVPREAVVKYDEVMKELAG